MTATVEPTGRASRVTTSSVAAARRRAVAGGPVERVVSPRLIGRSGELGRLVDAVTDPPVVVVVEGEAGVGKTRLVTELPAHPAMSGRRLVVGACRRIREPLPLAPVIEVARTLGENLRTARLSPVAGALRPLLPEIADLLPPRPEPLDDRDAERHRVFRGLVEVLASLDRAVLVLEDLHWADDQTLDFVSYLIAAPPPGLAFVLTYRGGEASPEVRALPARVPAAVRRTEVALRPLDARETSQLTSAILGLETVSEEFATHLCERASGLPLAVEELLALLQARGTLVRRQGRWARKDIDELDVPTGIRDPVLERVGRLSPEARTVVDAAAILQAPVPAEVLLATCLPGGTPSLGGLDEALASGLLVDGGDAVGFRHVLAAQAVYHAMTSARRTELHGRAVSALTALPDPPLGQLAHHLRQAGRLAEWATVAERAADQAARLRHYDEAVRLLEEVLRHAPLGTEQRGRIAVQLGRAAFQALRPSRSVAALLSDMLDADLPPVVLGELRLRQGLLLQVCGAEFRDLRELYVQAVGGLAERPDLQGQAMAALSLPCVRGIALSEHKKWLDRSLAVAPAIDDPAWRMFLLGKVAMVQVAVGDPAWRSLTDRIVGQTNGAPRRDAELGAYVSVAWNACYAGHLHTAEQLATAAWEGATTSGNIQRELRSRAALALLDYCRGAWDGLRERADEFVARLTAHPARSEAEVVSSCLALAHGDLDRASRSLADQIPEMEARGAFDLLPFPSAALIRLTRQRGDAAEALAAARRYLDVAESAPFEVSAFRALPMVCLAFAGGGRLEEARALVREWAARARRLDAPLAVAALPHARGHLAAAAGRHPTAAGHFLTAAERYDQLDCPYEAAQAREEAAAALFGAGRDGPAAEALHGARSTYQRLGASWDAARATSLARRHRLALPTPHRGGRRGYGNALSPREREVADLVADGRTNREIAAHLFISVKTVERHVSVTMRKLGAASRTAVASSLAAPNQGGDDQE